MLEIAMDQLGRGVEFIGYAARFPNNSDLGKLNFGVSTEARLS